MFLTLNGFQISLVVVASLVLLVLVFFYIIALLVYKRVLIRKKKPNKPNLDLLPEQEAFMRYKNNYLAKIKDMPIEVLDMAGVRGIELKASYFKNPKQKNPKCPEVILISHGWESTGIDDLAIIGDFYYDLGYDLLVPDHMGHGKSGGNYYGFSILDSLNLLGWIKMLNERYQNNCKIYLHGVSMGAAAVMLTANKDLPSTVKCIIEDCGFANAYQEIKYTVKAIHIPVYPTVPIVRLICKLRLKYDLNTSTIPCMKEAKVPVLFIHGAKDNFVPLEFTKENYEACTSKKEIKVFPNATHATSNINNSKEYSKVIIDFINNL